MKRQVFTGKELLIVAIVLFVIGAVVVWLILGTDKKVSSNSCDDLKKAIISCSKQYIASYESSCGTVALLNDKGFFSDSSSIYSDVTYKISQSGNNFEVAFIEGTCK